MKTVTGEHGIDGLEQGDDPPIVNVSLLGLGSRLFVAGREITHIKDVKVHQPLDGPPEVTVTFLASEVTGLTPEQALINHCEVCGPQFDRLEGNRCERHKSV